MNIPSLSRTAVFALLAASVAVCSVSASGESPVTSLSPEASQLIGPAGGVVEVKNAASPLYGSKVVIPAGVLSGPTEISINRVIGNAGYPGDVLVTDIEPRAAVLAKPVFITLKYSPQYLYDNGADAEYVRVQSLDGDAPLGGFENLAHDPNLGLITFRAIKFGGFVPQAFSNATLSGAYEAVQFRFDRTDPQGNMPTVGTSLPMLKGPTGSYGTLTFNGAGSAALSATKNKDGALSSESGSSAYSVNSTGGVTFSTAGLTGQVLSGGAFVAASYTNTSQPGVLLLVKKSGTFSNASLNGTYEEIQIRFDRTDTQAVAPKVGTTLPMPKGFTGSYGTLTFNGAGSATISGTKNKDGALGSESGSSAYSVTSTGAVTFSTAKLTGQVLAGGALVIASYTNTTEPGILLLVKRSGTFSNASLNGAYEELQFRFDRTDSQALAPKVGTTLPTPKGPTDSYGTLTFNGAGSATISGTKNKDGTLGSESGSSTYSVASNGAVTFSTAKLSGQVLAGGSVVIAGYTNTAEPGILILIKK